MTKSSILSPLICTWNQRAGFCIINQRTGFYIIGASVMKELTKLQVLRPETSSKRDSSIDEFFCEFCAIFQKTLLTEKYPGFFCWFLHSNQSRRSSHFVTGSFSFIFVLFFIYNCNNWSLFWKCIKMQIFLLLTIVYAKICVNVVKAILPRQ